MHRGQLNKSVVTATAATLLAVLISGCGIKPPECTSPDIGKTLVQSMSETALKLNGIDQRNPFSAGGKKVLDKYFDAVKVKFGGVVENGYNKDSKARTCSGDLSVVTPTGLIRDMKMEYGAQMNSDGKNFVVRYDKPTIEVAATFLAFDVLAYAAKERELLGDWSGTFSCSPVEIQNPSGLSNGGTAQVTFKANAVEVTPELIMGVTATTRENAVEQANYNLRGVGLAGSLNPMTDKVTLISNNSAVVAEFSGLLSGNTIELKGERLENSWIPFEGKPRPIQKCSMSLTKGVASTPAASSQASAPSTMTTAQATPTPSTVQTPSSNQPPATTVSQAKESEAISQVSKPSFDCAKASTNQEKLICSSALLGKLDAALSDNYKKMPTADFGPGGQANFKAEQMKWLLERNRCLDAKCLEATYRKRVNETCEYGVVSGVHPTCTMEGEIK